MAIRTLLKSNIRHKKGTFISIVILMIIISMSISSVLSIQKSSHDSVERTVKDINSPFMSAIVLEENLTEEMLNKVKKNPNVEKTQLIPVVHMKCVQGNGPKQDTFCLIRTYDSRYKILKNDLSGYSGEERKPAPGEIFVPVSFLNNYHVEVGQKIKIGYLTTDTMEEVKIGAVVADLHFGSMTSSMTDIFVCKEDLKEMKAKKNQDFEVFLKDMKEKYKDSPEDLARVNDMKVPTMYLLEVRKSAQCTLSDAELKVALNLESHLVDKSVISITNQEAVQNAMLYPDIICALMLVFLIFLTGVVLLVIRYVIVSSIELDYSDLGVIKAMGFTSRQIRLVFTLQYLLAQVIGSVIGLVLSLPVIMMFGNVFQPLTGIPTTSSLSILNSLLIVLAILAVSVIFIFFSTRKVVKVSPMKAIRGLRDDVYFSSRLNRPIRAKMLSASLGLRQFNSNKKKYISTTIIASILVFFMLTITILGDTMNSKSSMESMGMMITEVNVGLKNKNSYEHIGEIEQVVQKYSDIERRYYYTVKNFTMNGVKTLGLIFDNEEGFNIIQGRAPKYDNEIAVTEFIAQEQGIQIGSEVTLKIDNNEYKYMVVGIHQSVYEGGHCLAMTLEGAKHLDEETAIDMVCFSLKDPSQAEAIGGDLMRNCSSYVINVDANEKAISQDPLLNTIIDAMKIFIYSFSIVFTLVVVLLVCKKAFLHEKTDIGIYKAIGFKVSSLRLQFATRFLIIALLGAIIGSVLSLCFSNPLLTVLIRNAGVASFRMSFNFLTFFLPVMLLVICFFVFAYLVSRSIKKVHVKSLIFE